MTTHYGKDALAILTNNVPSFEEMSEGEQGKFNHADCPNGVDNRQRLYVKNVDGAYLGHCHNCGDSLYYRPRETIARIKEETSTVVVRGSLPTYIELTKQTDYDKFNVQGQLWLGQYGFNKVKCHAYHINESTDGIILPVYREGGGVAGCQVRRYNKSPKYLTYSKQRYSYLNIMHTSKPLILVEDLLSSYKLHIAGYPTLCLLGTKLDDDAKKLLANHRRVVLWLDDDVAGHSAAHKLFRELSPLCPQMTAIMNYQPKELDMEILKEMEI